MTIVRIILSFIYFLSLTYIMKKLLLVGILAALLVVPSAFALNITVSSNKERVLYGENFTISGKIMNDNGTTGVFSYRAAVVAPKKILVCDSGNATTDSTGSFSVSCHAPTLQEAQTLGIPAVSERAVVPLRPGVAVYLNETNTSVKKHGKEILSINPEKFKKTLDLVSRDLDKFVDSLNKTASMCDKISERAIKFNITNIADMCDSLKSNITSVMLQAENISAQAKQLKENVNSTDLKDFRAELSILKDSIKDLRNQMKSVKDSIKSVRWDTLKEVKNAKDERRNQSIQKIKDSQEELREKVKERRNKEENETQ